MITILCNGHWLDMPLNASLRIDEEMPQFQSDIFQGDVSFPMELPWSPTNVRALGYLWMIDVAAKTIDFTVDVYASKIHMGKARLIVQKASQASCTVNIVKGLAGMEIVRKKLPEFDYGGDRVLGVTSDDVVAHATACAGLSYPAVDYNFPVIRNSEYYGSGNADFGGVINEWSHLTNSFRKNGEFGALPELNSFVLIPQPYLLYILKTCFNAEGYEIAGDFTEDADIQQAMLYSNRGLDKALPWYDVIAQATCPLITTSLATVLAIDDDSSVGMADVYDQFDTSLYEHLIYFPGKYEITLDIDVDVQGGGASPVLYIEMLQDGSPIDNYSYSAALGLNSFSYTFNREFVQADTPSKLTFRVTCTDGIFTHTLEYSKVILTVHNAAPGLINMYATELNVANHVPDITLGELLRRLRGAPFFLDITADRFAKKIYFNFTEQTLLRMPNEDLTDKIAPSPVIEFESKSGMTVSMGFPTSDKQTEDNFLEISDTEYIGSYTHLGAAPLAADHLGKIIFIENLNSYFESRSPISAAEWVWLTDRNPKIVIGDGSENVVADITPLLMTKNVSNYTTGIGPILKQKGQSDLFNIGLHSFQDTRLTFWKGITTSILGQSYPFATSMNLDHNGNVVGDLFLRNDGTDGLYERYMKKWLAILMRGEILRTLVNYTINDLVQFIPGKKRLKFQSFFIRKRSTVWSKNVSSTEIEMIKL